MGGDSVARGGATATRGDGSATGGRRDGSARRRKPNGPYRPTLRPVTLAVSAAVLCLAFAPGTASAAVRADAGAGSQSDGGRELHFGAFVPGQPEQGLGGVRELESELRRRISVVLWYQHWGSSYSSAFNPAWLERVASDDRAALLTWEPWNPRDGIEQRQYRLAEIVAGRHDDYIRGWARALAASGLPVYLRPMHEMNANWYPWGAAVNGNTPAEYRAAWRRLHDIFRQEGATNVRWVWCVNARSWPAQPWNRPEAYYPGRRYVDVLAVDGYNRGGSAWRSFDQTFGGAYARLERLGPQPIWIAETASQEGPAKAAWIRTMFRTAESRRYARLQAVIWFSALKTYDYRANSSPAAAAAFRDPRASGRDR